MKGLHSSILFFLLILTFSCQSQTATTVLVGGPCEGCEAIFEYDDKQLSSAVTLPDFEFNEPKLKLTGIVYQRDGKTPASNVIIYIYQTDRNGIYPKRGDETGWARRHGYIRGWLKTDKSGRYTINTFRPAAYPNGAAAEHIHLTVKEEDKNEYYIDDFFFNDDPLLTNSERKKLNNRCGSGIVQPELVNGIFIASRDIILGLNIPNYD